MTEEMFDIITESSGRGLATILNRMDFLQLVRVICTNWDSVNSIVEEKFAYRVLAQAQMIPLDLIPIDNREDFDSSGPMYDFALAFCEFWYGVADGTIDGSNWGFAYCNENANSLDVNLVKYLQYGRKLSKAGG